MFAPNVTITSDLVTGKNGNLIQPRAVKSKEEQLLRTRDKAEVFHALSIVKQMNEACDTQTCYKKQLARLCWMLKLEITCGEALIVSRYDPVSDSRE